MEKKVIVGIIVIAFLSAQASAEAFSPRGEESRNPSSSRGPQDDPAYLAMKAVLDSPAKKDSGDSLSQNVSKAAAEFAASWSAAVKWTTETKDAPQRGDPKTTYSQSENRYHSAKQVPPPAPEPEPTPVPEPEPTPEPTPEQEPLLDLTQWTVANTFQTSGLTLSVYFKAAEGGLYDVVLVVYDTVTGEPIQATGYRTDTIYEMPDMNGFTLVTTMRRADGSWMDKCALLGTGSTWEDVTTWIELEYDTTGTFLYATVKTIESLSLETLALPSIDSIIVH